MRECKTLQTNAHLIEINLQDYMLNLELDRPLLSMYLHVSFLKAKYIIYSVKTFGGRRWMIGPKEALVYKLYVSFTSNM